MKQNTIIEDEIDRIRLKIYEETKHMTPAQYIKHQREGVNSFIRECGYKFVRNPDKISMRLVKIHSVK